MASSKVMASSTSTNSDLARKPSTYSLTIGDLQNDQSKNFGSMSMDDLIRNIYGDNPPSSSEMIHTATADAAAGESSLSRQPSFPLPKSVGNKTVDEVWKEISASSSAAAAANGVGVGDGNGDRNGDRKVKDDGGDVEVEGNGEGDGPFSEMTLEEFLTKAGAVREEDMKIPQMVGPVHGFVVDPALDARYPQQQGGAEGVGSGSGSILWLGNGGDRAGGGRGKRRAVLEPIDKAAQQRQRRMIKNRESAARSRERKQAYTVELESLVTQLEEENARIRREQALKTKERYNQLMESIIPVEEKRKPRRVLQRVKSTIW